MTTMPAVTQDNSHEQRLVTSLLEYVFSLPIDASERIRLVTGCLDLVGRTIQAHGQDLIGKTSGEATNPGPGLVANLVDAVARERADGMLSPHAGQFVRHFGRRGLVADGIRAIKAGLAVKSLLSAAADPHANIRSGHASKSRGIAPGPHGQEVASITSGEASNPGPMLKPKELKRKQMGKKKTPSAHRAKPRSEYSLREHPAFTAGVVVTPEPQVQTCSNGVTYVRHCQLIGNVVMPATGTAFAVLVSTPVNPGLFDTSNGALSLGPWCTDISKNFESYTIVDNAYSWRPSAAATDRGMIGMAYDYDVSDSDPTSFQSLSAYGGSAFGNVSETFTVHSDPDRAVPSNKKLLRSNNNFSGDPRIYDFARLLIAGEGLNVSPGVILGTVWATYTIKYMSPHVGSVSMNLNPARCVFGFTSPQGLSSGALNSITNPNFFAIQTNRLSGFICASNGVITVPRGAWNIRMTLGITQTSNLTGSALHETSSFEWFQPGPITTAVSAWAGSTALAEEGFQVTTVGAAPSAFVRSVHWNKPALFTAESITWAPQVVFVAANSVSGIPTVGWRMDYGFVEFIPL